MWLEPVPERLAQHAGRGSRRTALHDVMLSIEKVGRVPRIKRKFLESCKRLEHGRGPFPAVAHQSFESEGALSLRESADWQGIPTMKIEISEFLCGTCRSPWIGPFAALWRTVRRAMPLRFGRQTLPFPASIGTSLGVTHINRPIKRQRNLVEHGAKKPLLAHSLPKTWRNDILFCLPCQVRFRPEIRIVIAARQHELQEFSVCHFVTIHCESRHGYRMSFELVIPSEHTVRPGQAKHRRSRRDCDHFWSGSSGLNSGG